MRIGLDDGDDVAVDDFSDRLLQAWHEFSSARVHHSTSDGLEAPPKPPQADSIDLPLGRSQSNPATSLSPDLIIGGLRGPKRLSLQSKLSGQQLQRASDSRKGRESATVSRQPTILRMAVAAPERQVPLLQQQQLLHEEAARRPVNMEPRSFTDEHAADAAAPAAERIDSNASTASSHSALLRLRRPSLGIEDLELGDSSAAASPFGKFRPKGLRSSLRRETGDNVSCDDLPGSDEGLMVIHRLEAPHQQRTQPPTTAPVNHSPKEGEGALSVVAAYLFSIKDPLMAPFVQPTDTSPKTSIDLPPAMWNTYGLPPPPLPATGLAKF